MSNNSAIVFVESMCGWVGIKWNKERIGLIDKIHGNVVCHYCLVTPDNVNVNLCLSTLLLIHVFVLS